jgi:hypothetical protein
MNSRRTILGRIWRGIAWIATIAIFAYTAFWLYVWLSTERNPPLKNYKTTSPDFLK